MQVDASSPREAATAHREAVRAEAADRRAEASDLRRDQRVEESREAELTRPQERAPDPRRILDVLA